MVNKSLTPEIASLHDYVTKNKRYNEDDFKTWLAKAIQTKAKPLEDITDKEIKQQLEYNNPSYAASLLNRQGDYWNAARLYLRSNRIEELSELELEDMKTEKYDNILNLYKRVCYQAEFRFRELGEKNLVQLSTGLVEVNAGKIHHNGFSGIERKLEEVVNENAYNRLVEIHIAVIKSKLANSADYDRVQ